MNKQKPKNPILCALDTTEVGDAKVLTAKVRDIVGGIKLGLEFFCANGPKGVLQVTQASALPFFLDLKLHDIPNTVAGAMRAAVALEPFIVTVHTGGGRKMMEAAAEAAKEAAIDHGVDPPLVIGITVLTSLDQKDLKDAGINRDLAVQAREAALLAQESGLDGVVCSPKEVTFIRKDCGPKFRLITPGVRPSWAPMNDQKRVMSPAQAIGEGADYLVIGRPITAAKDPSSAAMRIANELSGTGPSNGKSAIDLA